MMRKRTMALCAAVLTVLSLAGCRGNVEVSQPTMEPSAQTTQQLQTQPTTAQPVFEELVLVDDEHCTFKIMAVDNQSIWGYTLKVFLENKTDKDLMFSLNDVSVNGYMCDPFWATTVNAGMKSNSEVNFSASDLERSGITEVTEIEFELNVYDSNDWTADKLVDEDFTVYPLGRDAVRHQERQSQPGDMVLFDTAQCAMIITGFEPEGMMGYEVHVYLKNKTDEDLMFSLNDPAVNGFMCDPFWAMELDDGKAANTTITWLRSSLEENGITQVESLSLPVRVYPEDDWTAKAYIDETFTVKP